MAPLYNRYVPPKPSAPATAPPVPSAPEVAPPASPEAEKKRKRERTEEQKAERKSKKSRAQEEEGTPATFSFFSEPEVPIENGNGTVAAEVKPQSEFAHVKNIKKRHKLEKEARKARKEAAKGGEGVAGGQDLDASNARTENVATAPVPAQIASEDAVMEDTVQDTASDATANRKKRRKDDDTRQVEHIPKSKDIEAGTEAQDGSRKDDNVNEVTDTRMTKKRRHKLEDALEKAKVSKDEEDGSKDEEDHLKNYAGVMGKFQKARQLSQKNQAKMPEEQEPEEEPEVQQRDLAPFPQPVNEPKEFKPTFSALPSWLAEPRTISNDAKASFADLGLPEATIKHLSALSFDDALPVQQALIPLLLQPGTRGSRFPPGTESVLPDIAVSAATGSGKTIAYLLPMIEALKKAPGAHGRLRGLVVVPTRELVVQVAAVAESLAKGCSLKVGISSGVGKFKDEQQRLVSTGRRYDPDAYAELLQKASRRTNPPPIDSEDFDAFAEDLEQWTDRQEQELQDTLQGLVHHVPTYTSAVDLLVCTPGRLLEHLGSTLGFSITSVEWLVLDEADKLLDQQYDGFLQRIDEGLSRPRSPEEQDAREKYLRSKRLWDDRFERRTRKVVLSATMTRDISKLTALKLKRPQLVVVQGAEQPDGPGATAGAETTDEVDMLSTETGAFEIPPTLKEYCIPVGDGSEKPLLLLELLQSRVLSGQPSKEASQEEADSGSDSDSDSSASDSDSSDSSDESDSDDSSSSPSDGSSDEDSDDSASSSSSKGSKGSVKANRHTTQRSSKQAVPAAAPTVLIFTSSTESASRLSHLLRNLRPDWSAFITTLTKITNNTSHRATNPSDPVITISTDRAGRGLDTLSGRRITHVLQYDVPRALTAYVHRVGRTARAGAGGEAWTLYSDREARWFVNEIMRAGNVRRAEPVERVRLSSGSDEVKDRFAEVLAGMREMVFGDGK